MNVRSDDPAWGDLPWGVPYAEAFGHLTDIDVTWTEPEPLGVILLPDGGAVHVWPERQPFGFVSRHRR